MFVLYEPFADRILGLHFAWNANSIAVELFMKDMIKKYGKHPLWTDGGTWYALASKSMNLDHHVYPHGGWMWEVMERQIQRLKDRTESFDDLFPCRNEGVKCRLKHVKEELDQRLLPSPPARLHHILRRHPKNLGAGLR